VSKRTAALGSALFLLAAPGVVAGLIPWLITGWRVEDAFFGWVSRALGGILIAGGAAVLVHAFLRFVFEGIGTPAPVAPTQRLVVGGAYRRVRNPMYIAVDSIIVGQALLLGQAILFAYALGFGAVVYSFVHLYEEPKLRHQFGAEYDAYRQAVPRWVPRLRPWTDSSG
jgi:protein-S-isoprenylcysteine O-methyltransferase Ste14